jgi:phytoene dehydrogenase-like protein
MRDVTPGTYPSPQQREQNATMATTPRPRRHTPTGDHDAIVIGAGHNGLVTAAYLARAGMRTLLVEARTSVGGTAASEPFGGVTVNICNCDHLTFRTTPVIDELGLEAHGLRYLDVEPSQMNMAWSGGPAWPSFHDVERTLDALGQLYPSEVDGYRRYLRAATPAVRMVLDAAAEPPTPSGLARQVWSHRGRGAATLLRWSRRSAADVMREFFTTPALQSPAMVTGPMVWGVSPELPGTGLGALTYAIRHVGRVGRPEGGSGMVPESIHRAFTAAGGTTMLGTRVRAITCEGEAVRGVVIDDGTPDGTEITAPVVVSACNPHDTFLVWLRDPPASARPLVERWRAIPHHEGYESKIDGVITELPHVRQVDECAGRIGIDAPLTGTVIIAPTLAEMHRGHREMAEGRVLTRPGMFLNLPTVRDPSMAPPGRHVLSLEVIYTPYRLQGGWPDSAEPTRWLDALASLGDTRWLDTLGEWRAMTPDRYEAEFFLPAGHATSFAGGPLAALRNRDPELTKYETAVPGLYLTGAATFPGAGVWGASGRNAATVVLAHHG